MSIFTFSKETCNSKISYDIKAKLLPAEKTVVGREKINWFNYSKNNLTSLYFHLYLNAFKSELTTFMIESGGRMGGKIKLKDKGYISIEKISIKGKDGKNVEFTRKFVSPDDGNPNDQTVLKLELKKPISPGEEIEIEIKFKSKLPPIIARNGYQENCFIVAQWYPKLGVLSTIEENGEKKVTWNCHQYHRNGEFFSDFANYKVSIEVPRNFKVAASGEKLDEKIEKGFKKVIFSEKCIHDFAWAASPDFIVGKFSFDPNREISPGEYEYFSNLLGMDKNELHLYPVKINIFLHPSHKDFMNSSLITLKNAIKYYGLLFGPYPYGTITMVDPPPGAFGASGMEYPTFFTAGTSILLKYPPLKYTHFETVITHEFGHNYWQGMVANNEGEEAWIDEGINSFCESTVLSLEYGNLKDPFGVLSFSSFLHHRFNFLKSLPLHAPIRTFSWNFPPGEYGTSSYDKPVLLLLTFKNIVGDKNFFRFLRSFFKKFRFSHPTSEDFVNFAINFFSEKPQLKKIVIKLLTQGIYTTKEVDFFVKEVKQNHNPKNLFSSKVVVEKNGDFEIPVEIEFIMENGSVKNIIWDGKKKYKIFYFKDRNFVKEVKIDPYLKIAIDKNFTNNFYKVKKKRKVSRWKNFFGVISDYIFSLFAELN